MPKANSTPATRGGIPVPSCLLHRDCDLADHQTPGCLHEYDREDPLPIKRVIRKVRLLPEAQVTLFLAGQGLVESKS